MRVIWNILYESDMKYFGWKITGVVWNIMDRKLWELHESSYEHYESCMNLLELLYDSGVKNIYDSCTNLLELLYDSGVKNIYNSCTNLLELLHDSDMKYFG